MPSPSYLGTLTGLNQISSSNQFANPWMDLASQYAPQTITSALYLCEFLYLNNSTYRKASERIVNYFLTKVNFKGQDDEERKKFEKILKDDFGLMDRLQEVGNDFMCFSGDTKVVCLHGVFPIRDLCGKKVFVLSKDGVFREAEFKCYGRQELYEIELGDQEIIRATAEHRWPVVDTNQKEREVSTLELRGKYLKRVVAPRPEQNEEYWNGVRHGIVFGDGTLSNEGRQAHVLFLTPEKRQLAEYFDGYTVTPHKDGKYIGAYGLPSSYKQLPAPDCSPSYWYGFICGFLTTDGCANVRGETVLTQKSESALMAIADQLPRIGMLGGKVRGHWGGDRQIGKRILKDIKMHYLTLRKQWLRPEDFLRADQRKNFARNFKSTNYGRLAGVKDVRPTGIVEEVYCCVEMETHTLVVGNGVLTKNCYGNAFCSIFFPFTRVLVCQETKAEINIKQANFRFDAGTMTFWAYSPKLHKYTRHFVKDYTNKDPSKIRMVRWDPKKITIEASSVTQECNYWYDIPADERNKIRMGDRFSLENMPWGFIVAACKNQKFKFFSDFIFHLKEPALAGVNLQGWGIPSILSAFKNFFRLQVLMRYDEVLMMDYIVPLRILSPAQGNYVEGNALFNASLGRWVSEMAMAVQRHRVDGADWNFFPFPVNYQAVGGESRQLSPKDAIQFEEDRVLNARGIPPEMYRANMTIQAAPISLRLFERGHSPLVSGLNRLVRWTTKSIARHLNSGDFEAELESVKIADDLEAKAWRLQAMVGNVISKETALNPMNIDPKEEYRRILDQQKFEAEESQKSQQEMQMSQIGLGSEQPGSGQGGQAQGGITPGDLTSMAEQEARQLLSMDETSRRSRLAALRQSNDALHGLVLKRMDQLRNMARSQGMQQALPQVVQSMPLPGGGTGTT